MIRVTSNDLLPASRLLLLSLTLAGATVASAQVDIWALRKNGYFRQTSDASPTLADATTYFTFDAQVRTTGLTDFGSILLTGPTAGPVPLSQQALYWSYVSAGYPTAAALDAAYPTGPYKFDFAGGDIGAAPSIFGNVAPDWPTAIPALTGATYSNLQGWDPTTGDLQLTFNSHDVLPDIYYQFTRLTVYEDLPGGDQLVDSWLLDPTDTAFTLDDALFGLNKNYYLYVSFEHGYQNMPRSPYDNAIKDYLTYVTFSTAVTGGGGGSGNTPVVPEPSTYGAVAVALLSGLAFWRSRRRR